MPKLNKENLTLIMDMQDKNMSSNNNIISKFFAGQNKGNHLEDTSDYLLVFEGTIGFF